jgi:hypothetical protein
MDDKRARCASNGESLPRQRSVPCCRQDVGLISVIDGGRYSVCARYLCSSGCWPRRRFGWAERVVSLRLDICARGRALPLGFDLWRFGPGRYSILRFDIYSLPGSVVYLHYACSACQTRGHGCPLICILACIARATVFAKDFLGERFMFPPLPICAAGNISDLGL